MGSLSNKIPHVNEAEISLYPRLTRMKSGDEEEEISSWSIKEIDERDEGEETSERGRVMLTGWSSAKGVWSSQRDEEIDEGLPGSNRVDPILSSCSLRDEEPSKGGRSSRRHLRDSRDFTFWVRTATSLMRSESTRLNSSHVD